MLTPLIRLMHALLGLMATGVLFPLHVFAESQIAVSMGTAQAAGARSVVCWEPIRVQFTDVLRLVTAPECTHDKGTFPGNIPAKVKNGKVPSIAAAERLAEKLKRQDAGIAPTEFWWVSGLSLIGNDVANYAALQDPIWTVRFVDSRDDTVTNEAWINSQSGETRWIFPLLKNHETTKEKDKVPMPSNVSAKVDFHRPLIARPQGTPTSDYLWAVEGGNAAYFWCFSIPKLSTEETECRDKIVKELGMAKIGTSSAAAERANEVKTNAHDLWVFESNLHIHGLVKCGATIPGFASRGDFIWISRFEDSDDFLMNVAWISSTTGKVLWVFPLEQRTPETARIRWKKVRALP